jgi:hypothetical protein
MYTKRRHTVHVLGGFQAPQSSVLDVQLRIATVVTYKSC